MAIEVFVEGGRATLVATFTKRNTLTGVYEPADPTTTTFKVRQPDNTLGTFVSGVDAEVTHPALGRWECEFDVTTIGRWKCRAEGAGNVKAVAEAVFDVRDSDVL